MKWFKIIDIVIQLLLIVSAIIWGINYLFGGAATSLFITPLHFYFAVGLVQVTSLITHHFFAGISSMNHHRKIYAKLCLWIFLTGIILFVLFSISEDTIVFLFLYIYGLLWIFPFLAFYYLYICVEEYRILTRRELIHLK